MHPEAAPSQPSMHPGITLAASSHQGLPASQDQNFQQNSTLNDAAIPDLAALLSNPALSHTLTNIMTEFEMHGKAEASRYNATDTITSAPEFR